MLIAAKVLEFLVWPIIRSQLAKNDMSGYERAIHTPYGNLRMVLAPALLKLGNRTCVTR
jgi:HPt (histidine-containing phosphotransfer) domain-containing protein